MDGHENVPEGAPNRSEHGVLVSMAAHDRADLNVQLIQMQQTQQWSPPRLDRNFCICLQVYLEIHDAVGSGMPRRADRAVRQCKDTPGN